MNTLDLIAKAKKQETGAPSMSAPTTTDKTSSTDTLSLINKVKEKESSSAQTQPQTNTVTKDSILPQTKETPAATPKRDRYKENHVSEDTQKLFFAREDAKSELARLEGERDAAFLKGEDLTDIDRRIAEAEAAITNYDRTFEEMPDFNNDVNRVVTAGANMAAGDMLNAFALAKRTYAKAAKNEKAEASAQKTQSKADAIIQDAQNNIAEAKDGRGKVGQFLVDTGVGAVQLTGDAIANTLVPGSGTVLMGTRAFGAGAKEEQERGGTVGQQILSGTKSAAIEVLTEKIGGLKIYGGNALDGIVDKAIDSIPSSVWKTFARLGSNALSEGAEEIISGVLNPLADKLLKLDPNAKIDWEQTLRDGLIGGILGLAGTAADVNTWNGMTQQQKIDTVKAETETAVNDAIAKTQNVQTAEGAETPAKVLNTADSQTISEAQQNAAETVKPASNEAQTNSPANILQSFIAPSQSNIDNAQPNSYNNTINNEGVDTNGLVGETQAGEPDGRESAASVGGLGVDGRTAPGVVGNAVTPELRSQMDSKGIVNTGLRQLSPADSALFSSSIDNAKTADTKYGNFVSSKSAEDVQKIISDGGHVFLSEDNMVGVLVTSDGDIEGVFKNKSSKARGALSDILVTAISNGGNKLDCYGIGLVNKYAKAGFIPVARVQFSPQIAIEYDGWTQEQIDQYRSEHQGHDPDVYFMMHNGDAPDTVVANLGQYNAYTQSDLDSLPVMEYDTAAEYRDNLISQKGAIQPAQQSMTTAEQTTVPTQTDVPVPPAIPGQESAPGMKRSQTESNTLSGIAEKLGGEQENLYYVPITERQTLTEAVNRASADMVGELNKLADKEMWNAADIDTALTIYGRLKADSITSGDSEAVNAWAKIVQSRGTRSGQALQAFSKWTRTGAAQAVECDNLLNDATNLSEDDKTRISNKLYEFGRQYDSVADGDTDGIKDLIRTMNEYRGTGTLITKNFDKALEKETDFDWLKEYAFRQMQAVTEDATNRATLPQQLKAWQVKAQLTRLTTFARNIGGNAVFGVQDTLSQDMFGLALDKLVSKYTGKQTVGLDKGWLSSEARKGAAQAMNRSVLEVAGDINMNGDVNRYGQSTTRTNKMSGNGAERFMSRWEQLLGYSLTTSDRTFRGEIETSIRESLAKSGLAEAEIDEIAKATADYRLFQNNGKAAQFSKGVTKLGNKLASFTDANGNSFGLGDIINPYPGVPANLGVKALEYSPANIIKGGAELIKVMRDAKNGTLNAIDQNTAVMDIARGMSGVPLIVLLTSLFKTGLIRNPDDEDDYDVIAQNAAEGKTGVQINLSAALRALDGDKAEWKDGDDLMSISWLEPMNAFMAIASLIFSDDEDNYAGSYLNGTIQSVLDMPVMQNIANLVDNVKYSTAESTAGKVWEATIGFIGDAATGMIPAPVSQTAKTLDPVYRDTSSDSKIGQIWNTVLSNIPGLRETLPEKVDNYGNTKRYSDSMLQRGLNNWLLPGAITELHQTEVSAEIEKLYKATGDAELYPNRKAPNSIKLNGEKAELNADEKREYQKKYGDTVDNLVQGLIDNGTWEKLDNETKAAVVKSIEKYAADRANQRVANMKNEKYSSDYTAVARMKDPVEYFVFVATADKNKNDRVTQDEAFAQLQKMDYPPALRDAIWAAQGWKTSYTEYAEKNSK